jgi:hypothetical protein
MVDLRFVLKPMRKEDFLFKINEIEREWQGGQEEKGKIEKILRVIQGLEGIGVWILLRILLFHGGDRWRLILLCF